MPVKTNTCAGEPFAKILFVKAIPIRRRCSPRAVRSRWAAVSLCSRSRRFATFGASNDVLVDALNRFDDTYDATSLGNLGTETLPDVFQSAAYRASFAEDAAVLARTCGSGEYAGACHGGPAFTAKQPYDGSGRCPVAYRFNRFIEQYLTDNGFTADELRSLVGEGFSDEPKLDEVALPAA